MIQSGQSIICYKDALESVKEDICSAVNYRKEVMDFGNLQQIKKTVMPSAFLESWETAWSKKKGAYTASVMFCVEATIWSQLKASVG